ncbi:hypothetical protein [Saccharothrix deserti]|uniref:hypothetical protein n=1 Tax=Saccharothrix deserti TaxID=2593674 RepID=UPI00131DCF62|nr:hypothetical protein [Saccharothrix deserti]
MNVIDRIGPWLPVALMIGAVLVVAVARATAKAVRKTRQVSRMGGNTLRTLVATVVIGGGQWLIVANTTDARVTALALAVPAFVTAVVIVRALTVTTTEHARTEGGKR